MTSADTNTDANTVNLHTAHEVLKSEVLIRQMIEECKIDAEQLAGFIRVLQRVGEEEQKKAKKKVELEAIQTLIDSGILDAADLSSLISSSKSKAQTKTKPKAEGLEHFFVNPEGEVKKGKFGANGGIAANAADNPAKFFDWAKSEHDPKMKRSAFRVGVMTEEKMDEIAVKYIAAQ